MNAEIGRCLVRLGDVVSFINGDRGKNYPSSSDYVPTGISFISAADIKDGAVDWPSTRKISQEKYAQLRSGKVRKGDLLFCLRGSLGKVAFIDQDIEGAIASSLVIIRANEGVSAEYIYYYLSSPRTQQDALGLDNGSVQPNISVKSLSEIMVPRISLEEQESVARALSGLDRKARLNQQINQTLEQMAQAIFKSWFVDFEPVKAKIAALEAGGSEEDARLAAMQAIAGKTEAQLTRLQSEHPDHYAELRATADLFPSVMQESELGEVPAGWDVLPLGDQVSALRGLSYKGKGLADAGVPMHNLNSVLEGGGYKYAGLKHYSLEFKDKFESQSGDLLVANTEQGHDNLLIGYGATVPHFYKKGIFSHHLYRLRPKSGSRVTREFLAFLFRWDGFVRKVQGYSNGTTVNMLPLSGVEMPKFTFPSKEVASAFSKMVAPFVTQNENNYLQNQTLARSRDTLLPKLLSGEITVPGAKEQTAETEEVADTRD